MHSHAQTSVTAMLRNGSEHYRRERDLPRILPGYCADLSQLPATADPDLLARLHRALTRERRLGATRHWSYDLTLHKLLVLALAAEGGGTAKKNAAPGGAASITSTC